MTPRISNIVPTLGIKNCGYKATTTCHHGKVAGDGLTSPENPEHNNKLSHGLTAARGEKDGTSPFSNNLLHVHYIGTRETTAGQPIQSPEKSPTNPEIYRRY